MQKCSQSSFVFYLREFLDKARYKVNKCNAACINEPVCAGEPLTADVYKLS